MTVIKYNILKTTLGTATKIYMLRKLLIIIDLLKNSPVSIFLVNILFIHIGKQMLRLYLYLVK